jgi:myosin heavy subunit
MSNQFKLIELKAEDGSKDYFIEGYVSTIDPDFYFDIVDRKGQEATFRELNGADITMDLDHEEWRDPETGEVYDGKKNKLPIAKVVDKKLDEKGTWVKAKLNKYHPNFKKSLLPSIKEGFLHSFSIAYNVLESFDVMINDIKHRVIQNLKLGNIAITGAPVNQNAKFKIALKSMSVKMAEEQKFQELETQVTELKSENQKLSETNESLTSQLSELKSQVDALEAKSKDYEKERGRQPQEEGDVEEEEKSKKKKSEMKSSTELKSLIDTIEKQSEEITELKSIVQKVRETPANNAKAKTAQTPQEVGEINFKSLLGGTQ